MSQTDSSTPNKLNNTDLEILNNQLNTPSSEVPFSSNICSVKPLKLKISTKKRKKFKSGLCRNLRSRLFYVFEGSF